jgi:uncharacterized protein YecE (DUF72 family)
MDFGKVPETELDKINFSLPADSELTLKVLKEAQKPVFPELYVGCAKWGRKEWVGLIYPQKTKEVNFLDEYVKHFNSIELNAVFYQMPKVDQIRAWKEKAAVEGKNFKFFPKISRTISHIRRLKNAEEDTTRYLESISEFGDFLGPCFLQLSDNFGPKNFDILREYLEHLPKDFNLFVEVRHPDWYSDAEARKDFFELLYSVKKGAVITDASGRRDCVHMELPTPQAFIRFVGNGLHPTDYSRIDEWVEQLAQWTNKGLNSIYFFLHQHDEKDTPILADYTIKKLNEKLGTNLAEPKFISKSDSLF